MHNYILNIIFIVINMDTAIVNQKLSNKLTVRVLDKFDAHQFYMLENGLNTTDSAYYGDLRSKNDIECLFHEHLENDIMFLGAFSDSGLAGIVGMQVTDSDVIKSIRESNFVKDCFVPTAKTVHISNQQIFYNSIMFPVNIEYRYITQGEYIVHNDYRGCGILSSLSRILCENLKFCLKNYELNSNLLKINSNKLNDIFEGFKQKCPIFLEVEASHLNPASFISSMKDDFVIVGLRTNVLLTENGYPQIMYHMSKPVENFSILYDESNEVLQEAQKLSNELEFYQANSLKIFNELKAANDILKSRDVKFDKIDQQLDEESRVNTPLCPYIVRKSLEYGFIIRYNSKFTSKFEFKKPILKSDDAQCI